MKYFILTFLILINLCGCGDRFDRVDTIQGFTAVNFNTKVPSSFETIPNQGSLLLITSTTNNNKYLRYIPFNQSSTQVLPNDTYNFYLLGYHAASMASPLCFNPGPRTLTGTSIQIDMIPTLDACADIAFTTQSTIPIIDLFLCDSSEVLSNNDLTSTACAGAVSNTVGAYSVKIEVTDDSNLTSNGFISACASMSSGGHVGTLPSFPDKNFNLRLKIYSGGSCTTLVKNLKLSRALIDLDTTGSGKIYDDLTGVDFTSKLKNITGYDSGTYKNKIFIQF